MPHSKAPAGKAQAVPAVPAVPNIAAPAPATAPAKAPAAKAMPAKAPAPAKAVPAVAAAPKPKPGPKKDRAWKAAAETEEQMEIHRRQQEIMATEYAKAKLDFKEADRQKQQLAAENGRIRHQLMEQNVEMQKQNARFASMEQQLAADHKEQMYNQYAQQKLTEQQLQQQLQKVTDALHVERSQHRHAMNVLTAEVGAAQRELTIQNQAAQAKVLEAQEAKERAHLETDMVRRVAANELARQADAAAHVVQSTQAQAQAAVHAAVTRQQQAEVAQAQAVAEKQEALAVLQALLLQRNADMQGTARGSGESESKDVAAAEADAPAQEIQPSMIGPLGATAKVATVGPIVPCPDQEEPVDASTAKMLTSAHPGQQQEQGSRDRFSARIKAQATRGASDKARAPPASAARQSLKVAQAAIQATLASKSAAKRQSSSKAEPMASTRAVAKHVVPKAKTKAQPAAPGAAQPLAKHQAKPKAPPPKRSPALEPSDDAIQSRKKKHRSQSSSHHTMQRNSGGTA